MPAESTSHSVHRHHDYGEAPTPKLHVRVSIVHASTAVPPAMPAVSSCLQASLSPLPAIESLFEMFCIRHLRKRSCTILPAYAARQLS